MEDPPKLPSDEKKLSRVTSGHKGAFTRLERRVDDLLFTSIGTSNQLIEAEALLKTLQDKIQVIQRYDCEIELLIEDEEALAVDMDASSEFHEKAQVTLVRLASLIVNYKKALENHRGPSRPSAIDAGQNANKLRLPKLQLPSFTGSYTEWRSFTDLFRASVAQMSNYQTLKS